MEKSMSDAIRVLQPRWYKFLQNPVWYVTLVAMLAVATSYVPFLWWFAGLVALVWGVWLLWQFVGEPDQDSPEVDGQLSLNAYLDQTLAYQARIGRVIKATANKQNHFHLEQMAVQLDTCAKAVKEMVQRLVDLRQDDLVRHDLKMVPDAIARLESQLSNESNIAITAQLEQVVAVRKNQFALLERLQNTIVQTELQLEHTLSVLGSIYSQILIGQSTNHIADYGRLSADIDEEMHRLADQLEALSEVKGEYVLML